MLFVTVGTHRQSFSRLVKAVDDLVADNVIKDKVVMQIGNTDYIPKKCKWFRFVKSQKSILDYIKRADVVITHGGAGSIINSVKMHKPTIVVPRYKKLGEHTNDHQVDLATALSKRGRVIAVYDINNITAAIHKAKSMKIITLPENSNAVKIITDYISSLS